MADTELRTAPAAVAADMDDDDILPMTKNAAGSGLFGLKLSVFKAWLLGSATGGLPAGGAKGQVLTKKSATDGDADWEDATGGSGGGSGGGSTSIGWFASVTVNPDGSIAASSNIASVSGVPGRFTFTTPAPDANYLVVGSSYFGPYGGDSNVPYIGVNRNGEKTAAHVDLVVLENVTVQAIGIGEPMTVFFIHTNAFDALKNIGGASSSGSAIDALESQLAKDAALIYAVNETWYTAAVTVSDKVAMFGAISTNTNAGAPATKNNVYVVPAGKKAYLFRAYASKNVLTDPTYFQHRLHNFTTGAEQNPAQAGIVAPNGRVLGDGGGPILIGNAGDVLGFTAWSTADGNYRPQDCIYILTVV